MIIFLVSAHVHVWQSDYGGQPCLLQPSAGQHCNLIDIGDEYVECDDEDGNDHDLTIMIMAMMAMEMMMMASVFSGAVLTASRHHMAGPTLYPMHYGTLGVAHYGTLGTVGTLYSNNALWVLPFSKAHF